MREDILMMRAYVSMTIWDLLNSGYKFGQWFDMIWMEKMIGEHNANPHEVIWQQDFKS